MEGGSVVIPCLSPSHRLAVHFYYYFCPGSPQPSLNNYSVQTTDGEVSILIEPVHDNAEPKSVNGGVESTVGGDIKVESEVGGDSKVESEVGGDSKVESEVGGDSKVESEVGGDSKVESEGPKAIAEDPKQTDREGTPPSKKLKIEQTDLL